MSMVQIGSMFFGQGPNATLQVQWLNDDGIWEPHEVISIWHGNTATLDNGTVIHIDNVHRVRRQDNAK